MPAILFIFCVPQTILAQRFYSIVFSQLPRDMQLYARDDSSKAIVPFAGMIEIPGWNYLSVVTYRNGERVGYNKSVLNYAGKTSADFDLKPEIKAEMADYSFEVFACKGTDSISVVTRKEIVAGDFFVINGQSNAAAGIFGNWSSKYARTIGRIPDNNPIISPGDTLWIPAAWSWTYVGAWGLELQRTILEEEGIPTCIINGAIPGKKMDDFLIRDEKNPANASTMYGGLLKRVNVAQPTRIRSFIWMHGEQDVLEYIPNYAEKYDRLYKFWIKDYPAVEQYLVVQTNLILMDDHKPNPLGGTVRNFLRKTKYIYPKTEHFTAIGTPGYDGVHYARSGYEELGRRIFRFFRPKLYNSSDSLNVTCPDIIKAEFTSEKNNEIALTFSEGADLVWPSDTTVTGEDGNPLVLRLKDFFYLDEDETREAILSGRAEGNKVILTLKESLNASKISYLPSYMPKNLPDPNDYGTGLLSGPFLRNKRELGAFSFTDVDIIPFPILGVEPVVEPFSWKVYPNPSADKLTIHFEEVESGRLQVFSVNGQKMYDKTVKSARDFEIEILHWPAGFYWVKMMDIRGRVSTQKIIKY